MSKILTAKQKADELGISMRSLARTRHLYKHKPISARKFLYYEDDPKEAIRPSIEKPSDVSNKDRSRSVSKRRNVPFGDTHYSRAPGGSGENFRLLNQMRAKMSLEGRIPKEEQEAFTEALAHTVKKNYKAINEQRKAQLQQELMRNDELAYKNRIRSRNPIQAEPIRRYPYTMINGAYTSPSSSTWHYADRLEDQQNKESSWTADLTTKKKYYW